MANNNERTDEDRQSCNMSSDGKHDPDWKTVTIDDDGGQLYVDVSCKACGNSGCIGDLITLKDDIDW
jgi:hypothetical protein